VFGRGQNFEKKGQQTMDLPHIPNVFYNIIPFY